MTRQNNSRRYQEICPFCFKFKNQQNYKHLKIKKYGFTSHSREKRKINKNENCII